MTTKQIDYILELASLSNVAAKRAIVLAPGFLNDHTGKFVWIPFDCPEKIPCALYTHKSDSHWSEKKEPPVRYASARKHLK